MAGETEGPEFAVVMRGYDRRQVDEYLVRLEEDPGLPAPEFAHVMRGYDMHQVQRYLHKRASN